ncbi:MAG: hypothetical protein CVU39_11765 [Chloroflexi bacterium HGW-Chloroflexi-10]|nr:MAG: hypothetical protein CVU39_11765 [Chloroflexi bacterium HGW-Chloroflexi-10]
MYDISKYILWEYLCMEQRKLRIGLVLVSVFFLVFLSACGKGNAVQVPEYTYPVRMPTLPPMPSRTPRLSPTPVVESATPNTDEEHNPTPQTTLTSEPQTQATTAEVQPTITHEVVVYTATPAIPPTQSTGGQTVKIFLIAVDDNGASGTQIGCGDSLVAVDVVVSPTVAVLRAALTELLSIKDQYYGQSGLYTALYQSDLTIDSLVLVNGQATIHLKGDLIMGGTCDNPRIEEQLKATAMQFTTVTSVKIYVNGTLLEDVLSLK